MFPAALESVAFAVYRQEFRETRPSKMWFKAPEIPEPTWKTTPMGNSAVPYRPFQLLLLRLVMDGGEPPVCSNIKAAGPPSPKTEADRPMVWGSRSGDCAVTDDVQPWANSKMAYHRSRGVGARIIHRRKSLTSIRH